MNEQVQASQSAEALAGLAGAEGAPATPQTEAAPAAETHQTPHLTAAPAEAPAEPAAVAPAEHAAVAPAEQTAAASTEHAAATHTEHAAATHTEHAAVVPTEHAVGAPAEQAAGVAAEPAAGAHHEVLAGPVPNLAAAGAPAEADYGPAPQTFAEMGLADDVLQSLLAMGFSEPLQVQRRVYRPIMAGRDLIVQSRTGSGKTAAFGIPFVQALIDPAADVKNGHPQALALGPTRELALQVATEISRIAERRAVQVVPVYGGAPMGKQIEQLRAGGHMVAGTPGRVLDHLRRGTLKLDRVKVLVLDEADEMLSMGFLEDILEIIKRCPADRQTLLFSATMPDDVIRLAGRHQRSALMIQMSADYVGVSEVTHAYYMVTGMGRQRDLLRVLEVERPDSAVIFCNTREETSQVAEFMRSQGLDAEPISSDLSQADRERVMGRMKAKDLKYLVATDVAARGIDISDLSHVINYTFPESAEVYVHRTGRTGRAGKSGVAISLISPRELGNFYYLKLTYKIRPEERALPSEADIQTLHEGQYLDRLQTEAGTRDPGPVYRSLLRRILAGEDGERLVAYVLERHLANRPQAEAPAAEPRRERPRSETTRPRDDRPRDDRPRDDRPRDDRPRDERPRDERPRDDRPKDDRPKDDRPKDDRPKDESRDSRSRGPADREPRGRGERRPERDEAGRGRGRSDRSREPSEERSSRRRQEEQAAAAAAAAAPAPGGPVAADSSVGAPASPTIPASAVAPKATAPLGEDAAAAATPGAAVSTTGTATGAASADSSPKVEPGAASANGSEPDARRRRRRSGQGGQGSRGGAAGETRAAAAPGPSDIIHAEDGREFWEAWVDSRTAATAPPASGAPAVVASGAAVASGAPVADAAARPPEAAAGTSPEGASPSGERRPRRRGPRTEQSRPPAAGEARLYLNLGRRDNVDEAAIGQFLQERGLPTLPMELHTSHTYLYAAEPQVDGIVTALSGQTLATRAVVCERARR